MAKGVCLLLLLGSLGAGGGCASLRGLRDEIAYSDPLDRWATGVATCLQADRAWKACAEEHADEPCLHDFGAGFRHGYMAVARGGDGCPPTLPPRRYWNPRFEKPEGQRRISAWFAGYPQGALAAEGQAAGTKQRVPTSASFQGPTDFRAETIEPKPAEPSGTAAGESAAGILPPPQPAPDATSPRPDDSSPSAPDAAAATEPETPVPAGTP